MAATPRLARHSVPVRLTHWVNAVAMTCMFMSGWGIYDANAFWPVYFPRWATLGGWLGGSIAWHFAMMWLLVGNGLLYLGHGLASRHFFRDFLPISPRAVWRDFRAAISLRLDHHGPGYNAVQRLAYLAALLLGIGIVVSGLCLWKPVQLESLVGLVGGYEVVRRLHFLAMTGLALFVVVHLALVIAVPRTLPPMITGRERAT